MNKGTKTVLIITSALVLILLSATYVVRGGVGGYLNLVPVYDVGVFGEHHDLFIEGDSETVRIGYLKDGRRIRTLVVDIDKIYLKIDENVIESRMSAVPSLLERLDLNTKYAYEAHLVTIFVPNQIEKEKWQNFLNEAPYKIYSEMKFSLVHLDI